MFAQTGTEIATPSVDWFAIAPILAVAGAAVLIVLVRALLRDHPDVGRLSIYTGLLGLGLAALLLRENWLDLEFEGSITTVGDMVRVTGVSVFLSWSVVLATALVLIASARYLDREGFAAPEYVALMLMSASGMLIMASANDLIVVFLALEILSIPLYVLAAFDRRRLRSQEAGLKYFVLGAFSSAIFLYGIALTYGATGTTSISGIDTFLSTHIVTDRGTLLVGLVLLIVGIAFKIAAAPFHMWAPDVYEGAPTPVTAFMASATKIAGFAAAVVVLVGAFPMVRSDWRPLITGLGMLTLVVGAFGSLVQADVKRMLAYLSVTNVGFIIIGVVAAASGEVEDGLQALLVYLLIYGVMIIGTFAVLGVLSPTGDRDHSLAQYAGIARVRPVLAGVFVFFLLAQAGVPFTGGFVIKLQVFWTAAETEQYPLLVVGVLSAVVAAAAYLRVVVTMVARPDEHDDDGDLDFPAEVTAADSDEGTVRVRHRVGVGVSVVAVFCAAVTLWFGIVPGTLLDLARDAVTRI